MTRHFVPSRILHWVTAALILWQIGIVSAYKLVGQSPLLDRIASLGPSHGVVGLIVLPLALLRLARYPRVPNPIARLVHHALCLLLVAIPALGLLRAYGSGKGWSHWGLPIIPETGAEIAWMVTLGEIAHGELAWVMTGLIGMHVGAAVLHRIRRGGMLPRD